jgi:hypothetical protein
MRSACCRDPHSGSHGTIALAGSVFNFMQGKHGNAETAVRSYHRVPTSRPQAPHPRPRWLLAVVTSGDMQGVRSKVADEGRGVTRGSSDPHLFHAATDAVTNATV